MPIEDMKEYLREWHKRKWQDPEWRAAKIAKSRKRQGDLRSWFADLKGQLFCSRCGFSHVGALHFHHLEPSKKEVALAEAIGRGWSRDRILSEIEKCEVLCANCHSILHYEQRQSDIS